MTTAPDKQAVTRWGIVAAAMFAGIIAAGHVGKLPPALPSIRAEFGLSLVSAGWLASLFSVTGMLIGIFLGALADRLDHWRLAIGGLALMGVSGFYGSLSTAAPELFFSRFSEGIGFLGVAVAAPAIIARATHGRDRSSALGLWPAYMPGGISLMILAAPLALHAAGWRGLWVAVAVLAMCGAVIMWALGHGTRGSRTASSGPPMWQNLRSGAAQPGPWLVGGCFALYGAQLYAI
ncbi:MAG: MFS transporter, partial [Candidatus Binataceae bacterium]